ncbi:hypothetical protein ScPMuIL_002122, partial [Solemya velum]
ESVASIDTVRAVCQCIQQQPLIETVAMSTVDIMEVTEDEGYPMAQIDIREIRQNQRQDPLLALWVTAVRDRIRPNRNKIPNTRDHARMFKIFGNLVIIRGVLYRKTTVNGEEKKQLVLPQVYIEQALRGVHDNLGHPGRDRTLSLLRERFYWPGMSSDTESW